MVVYLVYAMKNVRDGGMEVDHWCETIDIFKNKSDAEKLKELLKGKIDGEIYIEEFTVEESLNLNNYHWIGGI